MLYLSTQMGKLFNHESLPILQQKKDIQNKKRRKEEITTKEAFIPFATFHIIYGMRFILEQEHLDENNEDRQKAQQKSIDYIFEIVEREKLERGEFYAHDKFFKESPTNRLIQEYILAKY